MKKVILFLLVCACLGGLGYSGYQIYQSKREYQIGDETYEELREYEEAGKGRTVRIQSHIPAEGLGEDSKGVVLFDGEGEPAQRTIPWDITLPEVDFEGLQAINPDVIGWIVCEGTNIDYPIVQGETNNTYLHHMFTGEYNYAGSIFMECQNAKDFSDVNTILYGHHMRNGSMFHDLVLYKEDGFYEEHPYMLILTPEHNYVLEIFAGFVSSLKEDSWILDFESEEERIDWLLKRMEKSEFETPVEVTAADRVVTLSTCSYEFSNARYVMYGILIEIPDEDAEEESGAAGETGREIHMQGPEGSGDREFHIQQPEETVTKSIPMTTGGEAMPRKKPEVSYRKKQ